MDIDQAAESGVTGPAEVVGRSVGDPAAGIGRARPSGGGLGGFDRTYRSIEEMLSDLLEPIRGELGVDTATILLLDEDRRMLVARAARGLEEEVRQGVQVPLARGFAGRVAGEARPVVIPDLERAEVVNPILREKGICSLLGVPIVSDGRVIGVLHVGSLTPRAFHDGDISLLQQVADRAAAAIDAANASEQRAATEIMQRTLLPEALPAIPGLRFSAKYLPAGTGVRMGGDWYDVFQLPDGRVTLVIGDVVGRGVAAASVMAEMRTAVRAYRMEGHDLAEVMRLLNGLVTATGRERSATVVLLELDLAACELTSVSAGHLPTLMVDPGGRAELIDFARSGPIGISPAAAYETRRRSFPPGSTLLLYTDGLVERRGESLDLGLERLRRAASRAAGDSDGPFADRVYRRLGRTMSVDDDIALLVVESLPLRRAMELKAAASSQSLPAIRHTVGRWLESRGCDEDEVFDIALATSEAAANAIEHAYGALPATFTIRCEHDGGSIRITVSDTGRWRRTKPFGRGRGFTVMRGLVDDVELNSEDAGTTVVLHKHVNGRSA